MTTKVVIPKPGMGTTEGTIAKWLKAEAEAGRIPHLPIGRKKLFCRAAVERTLAIRAGRGEVPRE